MLAISYSYSYFFHPAAAAAPSVQKTAAGWENTMAVKDEEARSKDSCRMGKHNGSEDEEASNLHPKTA